MAYLVGLLLVLASCGRIGFDGLSPGTGVDGPGVAWNGTDAITTVGLRRARTK